MTREEEALFRQAAREALAQSANVAMVGVEDPDAPDALPVFTVVRFRGQDAVAIVIPSDWEKIEDMEARCHGILQQESKALAGQRPD